MCTLYGAGCGDCYCCWRMFWFWGGGERACDQSEVMFTFHVFFFPFFPFGPWAMLPMQVSVKEALAVRAQLSWHSND